MNEPKDDWHLDRRLQITHILTSVTMIVGAALYLGEIRKDVELLKQQQATQAIHDSRQDRDLEATQRQIKDRLDRMEDLLQRLLDRQRGDEKKR